MAIIKATPKYNFAVKNPCLAKEWHPTKNGKLTPKEVTPGIIRKVWWKCKRGHEWQASPNNRSKGSGCPYCSNQKVCKDNCLATVNPILAKEWHPTKNGVITPESVTPNNGTKVWWRCKNGHEWQAVVGSRNHGNNCPYCSNFFACVDNCLKTINPRLASEWHPTRNGSLTPKDVTPGSEKKAWWLCKRGHSWQATVASRNSGNNCPLCHSQTSYLELRIFSEIKHIFGVVKHRQRIHDVEVDIFLPQLNFAIEIDGVYWHKHKFKVDKQKNSKLFKNGTFLLRLREEGLRKVNGADIIVFKNDSIFSLIEKIMRVILENRVIESKNVRKRLKKYLKDKKIANEKYFIKLLERLPSPPPEKSLKRKNPKLAREWHPTRNGSLTAADVTPRSNKKVWWKCKKGHEWQAAVNNRNRGGSCSFCSNRKVFKGNSLAVISPALAREWHPTKNKCVTPHNVTFRSNKNVWWVCKKDHEWQATVYTRSRGHGCPYCSNLKVCKENCLQTIYPKLAKEWHPIRNGKLTPKDVTSRTARKVWWLCRNGHEWKAVIASRSGGSGCPYCSHQLVCSDNCLQTINPQLAREWHPSRNGSLTPKHVTPNNGKKMWWQCKKGHEWQAVIASRNSGRGCPYCWAERRRGRK